MTPGIHGQGLLFCSMMAARTGAPLVVEHGDFFVGLWLRVQATSKLPEVLSECVLLVWKAALGCNFPHLCHNAKKKGVE